MDNGTRTTPPGTRRAARLLLMSDTHLPRRAKRLPDELLQAVEQADVVVHAGDWVDEATLDLLAHRARRLVGVYGNNDGPGLRSRLPEVARFSEGGLRFGPCSFSQRYSPRCCWFMSAFDEGFLRGLLGTDARLVFSCRLTEGAACCRARFE